MARRLVGSSCVVISVLQVRASAVLAMGFLLITPARISTHELPNRVRPYGI